MRKIILALIYLSFLSSCCKSELTEATLPHFVEAYLLENDLHYSIIQVTEIPCSTEGKHPIVVQRVEDFIAHLTRDDKIYYLLSKVDCDDCACAQKSYYICQDSRYVKFNQSSAPMSCNGNQFLVTDSERTSVECIPNNEESQDIDPMLFLLLVQ